MAKIRVFEINKNGKIELSKSELETILNEVYNEGKADGKSQLWTWTPPYYNYSNTSNSTIAEISPLATTTGDKIVYNSSSDSASGKTTLEGYITGNESVMGTATIENPTIKTAFCNNPASVSKILNSIFHGEEVTEK